MLFNLTCKMGGFTRKTIMVVVLLAFLFLKAYRCGDFKKHAMYVCNKTNLDVIVYVFYKCYDRLDTLHNRDTVIINRLGIHVIPARECIYFRDLAWECQLSWWDYWVQDAKCDKFELVYFIAKYQKYNMDMWDIENVRKVAIDSIVLTRDSIEKMLPDCRLDII